jgi:LAS superfamily LD-carboxypeptidase LdcB
MRRIALLTCAVALLATACFPNGELPDSTLEVITPQCKVVTEIAANLRALLAKAKADNVSLAPEQKSYSFVEPPRYTSCYRDYEMQVWWRNYHCFFGNCGLAAVPGTSIHGWGRAVDFEDKDGELTFGSEGYNWLAVNAWWYGFVHPAWAEPGGANPEPWHWEAPG